MLRFYKHFFKSLAIANGQIAHTDAEPSYFYIRDKYNPDAFDDAIKNLGKDTCFLLESISYKTSNGNSRNYFKHPLGRFNIIARADIGDDDSISAAEELCESIADEFISKMRELLEEGAAITIAPGDSSSLVFFTVNDVSVDPIGPMNINYYGVSVGFTLKTPLKGNSNPAKWAVL